MTQSNTRVPDWMIERLAHGDLDTAKAAEIRRRLEAEPDGMSRLEAIEGSDREILEKHPPALMAAAIERRLKQAGPQKRRSRWQLPMLVALPVAAGAVAALMLVSRPVLVAEGPITDSTPDIVRAKGRPELHLYRQQGSEAQALGDGHVARARDVLQLKYMAAGRRYGAVLSIDGVDHVTWHLPEQPGVAELQNHGTLPHSYELDDAPGFERFVFVTSERPFDAARALEVLRSGTAPKGFEIAKLTLKKEQKP